jgi:hypothetical protein
MSKIIRSILIASLLAAGIILSPSSQSSASAAYCIGIYRIYYNSPGTDTGSNTSLNAEWIQLRNRCSTSRSLTSWTGQGPRRPYLYLRVLHTRRRQLREGPYRHGDQYRH